MRIVYWFILILIVGLVLYLSAIPVKRFIPDTRILEGVLK